MSRTTKSQSGASVLETLIAIGLFSITVFAMTAEWTTAGFAAKKAVEVEAQLQIRKFIEEHLDCWRTFSPPSGSRPTCDGRPIDSFQKDGMSLTFAAGPRPIGKKWHLRASCEGLRLHFYYKDRVGSRWADLYDGIPYACERYQLPESLTCVYRIVDFTSSGYRYDHRGIVTSTGSQALWRANRWYSKSNPGARRGINQDGGYPQGNDTTPLEVRIDAINYSLGSATPRMPGEPVMGRLVFKIGSSVLTTQEHDVASWNSGPLSLGATATPLRAPVGRTPTTASVICKIGFLPDLVNGVDENTLRFSTSWGNPLQGYRYDGL